MKIDQILKKSDAGLALNQEELSALMQHALNLLQHFNQLTQQSIERAEGLRHARTLNAATHAFGPMPSTASNLAI
jgi:hypothetical protein